MTDVRANGAHLPEKIPGDPPVVKEQKMSLPPNTVINGPSSEINVPFKDVQPSQEMTRPQPRTDSGFPQQPPNYPPAAARPPPPLTRIDSRTNLPIRPGFPNPPAVGIRPQQLRQAPPFIQRPPGPGPRPLGQPQFIPNPGVRPNINPNFRPATPYPRPPGPPGTPPFRQPGIFQPRPTFNQQRPPFEGEHPLRSQTLDSTESFLNRAADHVRSSQEDISRSNALKNRSLSMSSNASDSQNVNDEERRRSISSIGSLDGRRSSSGSIENLDKKANDDYPSRPDSRASTRMNKIIEDMDDIKTSVPQKLPSLQSELLQKNVEFKLPSNENTAKSPVPTARSPLPTTKPPLPTTQHDLKKEEVMLSQSIIQKDTALPTTQLNLKKEEVTLTKPIIEKEVIENDIKNIQNHHFAEKKYEMKSLDLKNVAKSKSLSRTEGDNDSGVDESTQGNDQSSNGDHSSPRKSSGKTTSRISSTTPTKNRSLSRGSKSPSLKSPDSTASTPGATEKKKLPMNKIQVGSAPSPNLKVVRSKIGSLENASYKPGGGKVKIESKKIDFSKAAPRIEAKNDKYAPKGGEKKIQQQKLQWNAKSKIGSLENTTHKPKGGEKKIESVKLDFKEKAKSKVGSKDNMKHVPGGGEVKFDEVEEEINEKIESKKLDIKAQSKIGSLDNMKHKPGGGEKKIFDDKEYLKQRSALTSENQSLSGSQTSLPSQPEAGGPLADVNLNQER